MSSQITMDDLRNTVAGYYTRKSENYSLTAYNTILNKLNSFMNMSDNEYSDWFDENVVVVATDSTRTTGIPKYRPLKLDELAYYDTSKKFLPK